MVKKDYELLKKDQFTSSTYGTTSSSTSIKGSERTLSADEVLDSCVGQFGRWQCRISILMSLLKFPIAWFQLGIVFLAPPTNFWCRRPPDYQNMSVVDWIHMISPNISHKNHTFHLYLVYPCVQSEHRDINNTTGSGIDWEKSKGVILDLTGRTTGYSLTHMYYQQSTVHGSCYMRDPYAPPSPNGELPPLERCPWGYEFDTSHVRSSIITEWQLVCGRERLIDLTQVTLMFGVLIGTLSMGIASDRFGRKPVLVACVGVQAAAGALAAFAPTLPAFMLARFVMAFANGGTMVTSFVICMEVVGGTWRTTVPILYQIPFGIGNSIMAGLAYLLREWRTLQLTLSLLSGLFLLYARYLPESPRWLIATGHRDQALRVLEDAARENGMQVSAVRTAMAALPPQSRAELENPRAGLGDLIRTPTIRRKTLLLCLQWFIAGISFYGFSQYMGQVSMDLHLTVAIGGLIALPGTLLCCFIVRMYGRRVSIAGAHLFTSACYLAILIVPVGVYVKDWPRIMLAALGVIGMSVSMPALYLFTGELFPTVIRNAGVGAAVMCSRVGSMLAPFVNSLSDAEPWLPLVVLGALVALEAALVLPLPETRDTALPDTVLEAETFAGKSAGNGNYVMVKKTEPSK